MCLHCGIGEKTPFFTNWDDAAAKKHIKMQRAGVE